MKKYLVLALVLTLAVIVACSPAPAALPAQPAQAPPPATSTPIGSILGVPVYVVPDPKGNSVASSAPAAPVQTATAAAGATLTKAAVVSVAVTTWNGQNPKGTEIPLCHNDCQPFRDGDLTAKRLAGPNVDQKIVYIDYPGMSSLSISRESVKQNGKVIGAVNGIVLITVNSHKILVWQEGDKWFVASAS